MTYAQAQVRMLDYLQKEGWQVMRHFKIPYATHKDGIRLWFNAQSVYIGNDKIYGNARSLFVDIRKENFEDIVSLAMHWKF
jgi:hypothetical protein